MASEGGLMVAGGIVSGAGGANILPFQIESGVSTDMFEGDLMKFVNASGGVIAAAAAADLAIVGVFVGCEFTNSDGQRVWSNKYVDTISRTDSIAMVNVNPFQLYIVKAGTADVDGTLVRTDIGGNFDLDYNAGNSTTGKSGMILDTGTGQAAGIAQVRLVGVTNQDGTNPTFGAVTDTYTHGIVMIDPLTSYWLAGNGIVA